MNFIATAPTGTFTDHGGICANHEHLLCPICGFEYTHMRCVKIHQGDQLTSVGYDAKKESTVIKTKRAEVRGRGTVVSILCSCEGSHEWVIEFQFHKGMTFLGTSDCKAVDFTEPEPRLWRD